jgi:gliding motility-associated-like protein
MIYVRFCPKATITGPSAACVGTAVTLLGANALSYLWTGPNNFSATTQNINIPVSTLANSGVYTFIAYGENGCNDTSTHSLNIYPIPTVFAGKDTSIVSGTTIQLLPTVSADVNQVIWSSVSFTNPIQALSINVTPTTHTNYSVLVKNAAGCSAQDDIKVSIICTIDNIFIPNTFTPNHDGMNDIFYPRGQYNEFINYLRIFDRWGNLVFERTNFRVNDKSKGWDGSYKGVIMNSGVFAYTIQMSCSTGETISRKGSIMILQ